MSPLPSEKMLNQLKAVRAAVLPAYCIVPSSVSHGFLFCTVRRWCYRFVRDIMSDICERVCSARPLRYRDVLELDRKIRGFPLHPLALRLQKKGPDLSQHLFEQLYPLITTWNKEESLMYIHRNFFARAILDFPDNPMQSPFAASFLATYRGASAVLRICQENMEHLYLHILRVWEVWSLCLTCGVCVKFSCYQCLY